MHEDKLDTKKVLAWIENERETIKIAPTGEDIDNGCRLILWQLEREIKKGAFDA